MIVSTQGLCVGMLRDGFNRPPKGFCCQRTGLDLNRIIRFDDLHRDPLRDNSIETCFV